MKTRTKATKKSESTDPKSQVVAKVKLGEEASNPPQLFILPQDIGAEARIITLLNPRYDVHDRYLICPNGSFYEFTRAAAPKTTPRSCLLSSQIPVNGSEDTAQESQTRGSTGYITRTAELFIATSIDPLFLLLPALAPVSKSSEDARKLFLSSDDYLEKMETTSPQFAGFWRGESLRKLLEKRMASVCDAVEAGDESMYRMNTEKLLSELLKKARKMVAPGLPASMDEKFVKKALEAPVLSIKREPMLELTNGEVPAAESQETNEPRSTLSTETSFSTTFSEVSKAASSCSEDNSAPPITSAPEIMASIPVGVAELLQLRTALYFIFSKYLAPHLAESLKMLLVSERSPVDFEPLNAHLAHLAKLRQEAMATRSLGDYSRKRALDHDNDEDTEIRAENKRRKEEEEKRKKAGTSVGLKKLQKVNTTGMKKMSDFFKKK